MNKDNLAYVFSFAFRVLVAFWVAWNWVSVSRVTQKTFRTVRMVLLCEHTGDYALIFAMLCRQQCLMERRKLSRLLWIERQVSFVHPYLHYPKPKPCFKRYVLMLGFSVFSVVVVVVVVFVEIWLVSHLVRWLTSFSFWRTVRAAHTKT